MSEAPKTPFTQAEALKRDNARMVEALEQGASHIRRMEYGAALELIGTVLASLEVREDG